jgi:hypothetical protein
MEEVQTACFVEWWVVGGLGFKKIIYTTPIYTVLVHWNLLGSSHNLPVHQWKESHVIRVLLEYLHADIMAETLEEESANNKQEEMRL